MFGSTKPKTEVTMKTTKFALIIAMLVYVSMSFATGTVILSPSERIALREAIADPGLCQAIYRQVDAYALLAIEKKGLYTVKVEYRRVIFIIYAKYWEWEHFFLMDPVFKPLLVKVEPIGLHH